MYEDTFFCNLCVNPNINRQHMSQRHLKIRDMFHVYLNRFEFHFLQLHINKTKPFCFFMHNKRVSGIAK